MRLRMLFVMLLCCAAQTSATQQSSVVPFVGCASDGQVGPLPAPEGKPLKLPIPQDVADRLAYYKAENGSGVLGPRGWHCFGVYGSSGGSLFVTPETIDSKQFFDSKAGWKGFRGDVIQISDSIGDTSGRFSVAMVIARVFPKHKKFVEGVIAEGLEPASDFPFGPYPADKLHYRSDALVEYETPANAEGLGTRSWLLANGQSIRGVEMLTGETPDLVSLAVRIPAALNDLVNVIVQQTEADAAKAVE